MRYLVFTMISNRMNLCWRCTELVDAEKFIRGSNQMQLDKRLIPRIFFVHDFESEQEWVSVGDDLGLIPLDRQRKFLKVCIRFKSKTKNIEFYDLYLDNDKSLTLLKIKGVFHYSKHAKIFLCKIIFTSSIYANLGYKSINAYLTDLTDDTDELLSKPAYDLYLQAQQKIEPIKIKKFTNEELRRVRRK